MLKLGRLIGLDARLREKKGESGVEKTVGLRVAAKGLELARLISSLSEGEEFMVGVELIKPQLPLAFSEESEVTHEG